MPEREFIEIPDATLIRQTERAGLFRIEDREAWIPWSQLDEGSVDKDGVTGSIYVTEWIIDKRNL